MLVLTRKVGEQIIIGAANDDVEEGCVRVAVVGIKGNSVRFGIQAPEEVKILRAELTERVRRVVRGRRPRAVRG